MASGLGKHYRKGLTLAALFKLFPDDATAEAWFADARWEGEPHCPHCGSVRVQSGAKHKTMPYRCRDCRKRFSVRTGTTMEASNLGYQTWAVATYLLTTNLKGVSSMKLHRDLGITQKSAWHLAHRIRKAWQVEAERFRGPVEADETFVGGREKNKHASRRLRGGRGTVGKVPVAGVKDRATNRVSAAVVRDTRSRTLQGFVNRRIAPDALVYTDEAAAYEGLRRIAVKHSVGEYVNGQAHTNGLESFWATLKRGYAGVYHKMSHKHLERYVCEFSGRHNDRPSDTVTQMRHIAHGLVGKRLTLSRAGGLGQPHGPGPDTHPLHSVATYAASNEQACVTTDTSMRRRTLACVELLHPRRRACYSVV